MEQIVLFKAKPCHYCANDSEIGCKKNMAYEKVNIIMYNEDEYTGYKCGGFNESNKNDSE